MSRRDGQSRVIRSNPGKSSPFFALEKYSPLFNFSMTQRFKLHYEFGKACQQLVSLNLDIAEQTQVRELLQFLSEPSKESLQALDWRIEQLNRLCSVNIPREVLDFGHKRFFSSLNGKIKHILQKKNMCMDEAEFYTKSLNQIRERKNEALLKDKGVRNLTLSCDSKLSLSEQKRLQSLLCSTNTTTSVLPSMLTDKPLFRPGLKKRLLKFRSKVLN